MQHSYIFIHENAFETVDCEMAAFCLGFDVLIRTRHWLRMFVTCRFHWDSGISNMLHTRLIATIYLLKYDRAWMFEFEGLLLTLHFFCFLKYFDGMRAWGLGNKSLETFWCWNLWSLLREHCTAPLGLNCPRYYKYLKPWLFILYKNTDTP